MKCNFLKNICCLFSTIAFIKSVWPYCCTYLLLFECKSRISLERFYACAIEKALVGKTMSLRDSGCGVYMSSMRSGQGDMIRDLPRGAVHASLRKLLLEEADMFSRNFVVVLVISSYVLYLFMHLYKLFWSFSLEGSSSNWAMPLEYSIVPDSTSSSKGKEITKG